MDETSDYTDTVMPMPIYTIAYKCIARLSQIEEIDDQELLKRVIYPDDGATPLGKGKRSPFNILGLRNSLYAACAAKSAMDQLNLMAAEIETSSAQQTELSLTTIPGDKDIGFRQKTSRLIRDRFPAARQALCDQLVESVVKKRLIILQGKLPTPALWPWDTPTDLQDNLSEYPPLPHIVKIQARLKPNWPETLRRLDGVRCPFCTKEMVLRRSDDDMLEFWIHHIN
ncbi:ankyrin repeat [Fusarium tjaetaba]|uniref:Ankyrin repeat n=1 Tax=Fusarium tjaetaba TaxID=1567544 RepID=A0A8H5S773_9HYPO|nr:ankyrin repeat [Fusarium tjaetaba]KAF5645878.1 ankyrin repeat [Fusarium tjaetaba]